MSGVDITARMRIRLMNASISFEWSNRSSVR